MSDLIDRQAAIDICRAPHMRNADCSDFEMAIMMLPPAPPEYLAEQAGILVTDTDTISRQAAIDFIDAGHLVNPNEPRWSDNEVVNFLKSRPSAQPEIIHCKDCKHWIPYDWMFSEVWRSKNMADYPEDEIGCNYCDMTMKANDFCSRGERREVTE